MLNHTPTDRNHTLKLNDNEISVKTLADAFNLHFSSMAVGAAIGANLDNIRHSESSISIKPTNVNGINYVIKNLKNSNAKDIDDIQIKPVKYVSDLLAPCIVYIFNLCLVQGCFPSEMQVARITVLHKKGDKNDMGNYRPVSILPIISKVLGKVILTRFVDFKRKHNLVRVTVWLSERAWY